MKRVYFLCLFIISASVLLSCKKDTPVLSKAFIKYFGGVDVDLASEVRQTSDGGFILIGSTNSNSAGGSDMYVVKTDQYGNEEWHKTFGDSLNDEGASVKQTPDGGYILMGTYMQSGGSTDVYAVKINGSGILSWSQKYGNAGNDEKGYSVANTYDGGFIILSTTNNDSLNKLDLLAMKTNGAGTISILPFQYGAKGVDDVPSNIIEEYTSGNYLMSSSTVIGVNATPRLVGFRENSGALTYNNAPINNSWAEPSLVTGGFVSRTNDGNFILVGTNNSNDIYLLKLDPSFNKLWSAPVVFGGSGIDEGVSVAATNDGGYILLGTTQSFGSGLKDIYLIKADANGNEEWTKTFGGAGNDRGHSVSQASDGGYIISGTIEFGNDITNKDDIMCLIKTDEKGALKNTK
jgi:hypothetical protein